MNRSRTRRLAFVLMAIALAALGGCAGGTGLSGGPKDPDMPSGSTDFQPVTDIPIPSGATLDNEKSLILSGFDRWTGRLVMRVGLSPGNAFAYYQNEMPSFQWEPVTSIRSGISVLTFTRGQRAATVQIEDRTFGGSLVTVTMAPRQPNRPRDEAMRDGPRSLRTPGTGPAIQREQLPPPGRPR